MGTIWRCCGRTHTRIRWRPPGTEWRYSLSRTAWTETDPTLGARRAHLLCFCRRLREAVVVVVVPRLVAAMIESSGISANLRNTFIHLPASCAGANLRDVFTGRSLRPEERDGEVMISAGEALRDFPVALLESSAND